ncbi:hypothetical protein A3B57_01355 [Microgenomates group bacterium RIFCSPLOWO2_01_FULL_47_10]|nr:MAG: hypothetical protein A3B57_01355 [Microgenomates group bacterium RIFCSPLOWO2_01_FULL_47_10]
MKLVLVGTLHHDFSRLVRAVIGVFNDDGEKVLLQYGFTDISQIHIPSHFEIRQFIESRELSSYMQKVRVIVISGGEATALETMRGARYTPIIFPRQKRFNEHVDDQQSRLARYFSEAGLALIAHTADDIGRAIPCIHPLRPSDIAQLPKRNVPFIVKKLSAWLQGQL